jgi:hypothetical protein
MSCHAIPVVVSGGCLIRVLWFFLTRVQVCVCQTRTIGVVFGDVVVVLVAALAVAYGIAILVRLWSHGCGRVRSRGHTRNRGRPSHLLAVNLAERIWVVSAGELAGHELLTGA